MMIDIEPKTRRCPIQHRRGGTRGHTIRLDGTSLGSLGSYRSQWTHGGKKRGVSLRSTADARHTRRGRRTATVAIYNEMKAVLTPLLFSSLRPSTTAVSEAARDTPSNSTSSGSSSLMLSGLPFGLGTSSIILGWRDVLGGRAVQHCCSPVCCQSASFRNSVQFKVAGDDVTHNSKNTTAAAMYDMIACVCMMLLLLLLSWNAEHNPM